VAGKGGKKSKRFFASNLNTHVACKNKFSKL